MPGMDGLTLLQQIKTFLPDAIIVMISGSEQVADVQKALHFGARGFIQKSSETSVLLAALQLILAGGTYIPPLMLEEQPANIPARQETASLTARQMDILQYLHQGQQNKVIAYELDLSEATVKVHVRHIFSVLGVKNRTQAVQKALELGIL
jgi:DNA-binding NarL/FixJ family response regulator